MIVRRILYRTRPWPIPLDRSSVLTEPLKLDFRFWTKIFWWKTGIRISQPSDQLGPWNLDRICFSTFSIRWAKKNFFENFGLVMDTGADPGFDGGPDWCLYLFVCFCLFVCFYFFVCFFLFVCFCLFLFVCLFSLVIKLWFISIRIIRIRIIRISAW